ncbi:MAG: hypothetical protein RMM10_01605 [Anaerolineae bacterium]|nr:hypothetical protein [Thermoflexus sp.]MDW8179648.1 hypothetical protein [Anaerolineae bacterium]
MIVVKSPTASAYYIKELFNSQLFDQVVAVLSPMSECCKRVLLVRLFVRACP